MGFSNVDVGKEDVVVTFCQKDLGIRLDRQAGDWQSEAGCGMFTMI